MGEVLLPPAPNWYGAHILCGYPGYLVYASKNSFTKVSLDNRRIEIIRLPCRVVAVCADDSFICATGSDKIVRAYRVDENVTYKTHQRHKVESGAIQCRNNLVVSGDNRGTIVVWDLSLGRIQKELKHDTLMNQPIVALAAGPGMETVAVGLATGLVVSLNLDRGECMVLSRHKQTIQSLHWKHDKLCAASNSIIQVWHTPDWTQLGTKDVKEKWVHAHIIDKGVLYTKERGEVMLWDLVNETTKCHHDLSRPIFGLCTWDESTHMTVTPDKAHEDVAVNIPTTAPGTSSSSSSSTHFHLAAVSMDNSTVVWQWRQRRESLAETGAPELNDGPKKGKHNNQQEAKDKKLKYRVAGIGGQCLVVSRAHLSLALASKDGNVRILDLMNLEHRDHAQVVWKHLVSPCTALVGYGHGTVFRNEKQTLSIWAFGLQDGSFGLIIRPDKGGAFVMPLNDPSTQENNKKKTKGDGKSGDKKKDKDADKEAHAAHAMMHQGPIKYLCWGGSSSDRKGLRKDVHVPMDVLISMSDSSAVYCTEIGEKSSTKKVELPGQALCISGVPLDGTNTKPNTNNTNPGWYACIKITAEDKEQAAAAGVPENHRNCIIICHMMRDTLVRTYLVNEGGGGHKPLGGDPTCMRIAFGWDEKKRTIIMGTKTGDIVLFTPHESENINSKSELVFKKWKAHTSAVTDIDVLLVDDDDHDGAATKPKPPYNTATASAASAASSSGPTMMLITVSSTDGIKVWRKENLVTTLPGTTGCWDNTLDRCSPAVIYGGADQVLTRWQLSSSSHDEAQPFVSFPSSNHMPIDDEVGKVQSSNRPHPGRGGKKSTSSHGGKDTLLHRATALVYTSKATDLLQIALNVCDGLQRGEQQQQQQQSFGTCVFGREQKQADAWVDEENHGFHGRIVQYWKNPDQELCPRDKHSGGGEHYISHAAGQAAAGGLGSGEMVPEHWFWAAVQPERRSPEANALRSSTNIHLYACYLLYHNLLGDALEAYENGHMLLEAILLARLRLPETHPSIPMLYKALIASTHSRIPLAAQACCWAAIGDVRKCALAALKLEDGDTVDRRLLKAKLCFRALIRDHDDDDDDDDDDKKEAKPRGSEGARRRSRMDKEEENGNDNGDDDDTVFIRPIIACIGYLWERGDKSAAQALAKGDEIACDELLRNAREIDTRTDSINRANNEIENEHGEQISSSIRHLKHEAASKEEQTCAEPGSSKKEDHGDGERNKKNEISALQSLLRCLQMKGPVGIIDHEDTLSHYPQLMAHILHWKNTMCVEEKDRAGGETFWYVNARKGVETPYLYLGGTRGIFSPGQDDLTTATLRDLGISTLLVKEIQVMENHLIVTFQTAEAAASAKGIVEKLIGKNDGSSSWVPKKVTFSDRIVKKTKELPKPAYSPQRFLNSQNELIDEGGKKMMMGKLPEGLNIEENFVTEQEQAELLAYIESHPWDETIKRRVQHFGYRFNYQTLKTDEVGAGHDEDNPR